MKPSPRAQAKTEALRIEKLLARATSEKQRRAIVDAELHASLKELGRAVDRLEKRLSKKEREDAD